ncbi:MAG: hypothetical protein PHD74_05060 [Candidatus Krumholzibacteria bacterium]|nr:hypothetical protein [Candidatus Krumholzibacteria bacterium]
MERSGVSALATLVILSCSMCGANANATASTHIWAPSTDVQAYNVWHITTDMYLAVENDAAGDRVPTITNVGLTVGVLPLKRINMEIGLDHKSGLGTLDGYPMYGNVKIGVPENALGNGSPAAAVGVFDVGTKRDMTDCNVIYGKIARTFSANGVSLGRFSVGYFTGNEKLLLDRNGDKDNSGLLAAWERTMTEISDKLWLCVEYMGTESVYGSLNIGASLKLANNVSMLGGYEIFNNDDLVDTVTLQVDIDM